MSLTPRVAGPVPGRAPAAALAVALILGGGCVENEFTTRPFDSVAVVTGDFDRMEATLDRLVSPYHEYEGFICCASYDPDIEPEHIALKAETLFTEVDEGGRTEMGLHDAVFVNSGARGFGAWQYNGVDPDDALVTNPDVLTNVKNYVERGNVLVVSDWAYDLVEAVWPDAIDFYGDDAVLDDAQKGAPGRITAEVVDEALAEDLQNTTAALVFNYSNWTVIEAVGQGTTVHLRGDAEYRISDDQGYDTLTGVPLLVSFKAGNGQVVLSSFHYNAQTPGLVDEILLTLIDGISGGGSASTTEDPTTGEEDTGDAG